MALPSISPRPATARPPGPATRWFGLPILFAMRRDYLGFTAALQRQYGDFTAMRVGAEQAYDLFAPHLVRAVLLDHAADLIRWERGIEVFEQVFGQSVLVTEGSTWQRQRRMLMNGFTPRKVAGYAPLMVDAATRSLDAAVAADAAHALVDMDALFTRLTMDVILRTLFGAPATSEAAAAAGAVKLLSENALREMFWPLTLPDWLPLPGKAAKRRAMRVLRGIVERHIAARCVAPSAPSAPSDDLLAMLLALRDDETGAGLSAQEVFDQCMVVFQAGHETSAAALLWWSVLMAQHPDAAARARAEVHAVLGTRAPTADDAAALPWTTATLKEAMRLYPPIAALMTRRAIRSFDLDGWTIPKGALLRITPWVLQRDARSFPAPERFVPERFLPGAAAAPRSASLAFGAGPRVCIGQHFALLEMTLVAALLLQRYAIEWPEGAPAVTPALGVTLRPAQPVHLRLVRHATPATS